MLAVCFQDAYRSNIQAGPNRTVQYIKHITMFTRGTVSADDAL